MTNEPPEAENFDLPLAAFLPERRQDGIACSFFSLFIFDGSSFFGLGWINPRRETGG